MTEQFPAEPARTEGSVPVAPQPAQQEPAEQESAGDQAERALEQPIPQLVPVRNTSVMLWAVVAGVLLLGGMTALVSGAFWYAQNYRNEQSPSKKSPEDDNQSLTESSKTRGTDWGGSSGKSDQRSPINPSTSADQERRREQESRRKEESARRQGKVIAFRSLVKKTQQDLDALLAAVIGWQTNVKTLLASANGRRIAGSAAHVERFVSVYEKKRVAKSDVEAFQARLNVLQQPLRDSDKESSSTYAPSKEFTDDVQTLKAEIQTALRPFQQDRLAVDGLLESTANLEPSKTTLQDAIAAFHRSEASRRAKTVAAARLKAQKEMDRKLAEAEAAKVAAEGRVKLLKIKAGKAKVEGTEKALAAEIQAAAKKREAARKKAELTRQFDRVWPRMRGFLVPFTSSGYAQPAKRGFKRTVTKGPVSFSKLQGAGFLKKDINSLKTLYYATTANRMNDRSSGAFPRYFGGAQDWARRQETIQTIQDFLNKYGTIMVEKKLLAP